MLKKILATALAAAMIFGLASMAFAAPVFPDTAGVANEAVIARLKTLGIVKGDDLGNFNPNNPITRAEFTTMVVRMLGLETAASYVATPTAFPDVTAASAWAYGYINIAVGRGLIKGYEDGTFRPGNNVTQAEALTILLRALGYTDNLPGSWPIDYIMKGAELGVISTGFAADTAATRMLIATLVNNTLDENLVKEDVTAAGTFVGFVDKFVAPTTLYQDAFDVAATVYLTGIVSNVDTKNGTITIGSNPATDYVSSVAIYGKDTLAELKGQTVKATLNDDGDIIFIAVTTKQEVVGDITAVDTVNLKVTVGGTQYTVLSTAEVVKNGAALTTTIAGALVAVKDSSATLLLNSDGKVYRIVASLLDQEGTITGKSTMTAADGTVTNKVTIGAATYNVKSTTTIVRNGASATYADLAVDDEVEFSYNGSDLVYVDAFINVLEDYKVTNYVADASGATVTATKDGVETSFSVAKNSSGTLLVTLASFTNGLGKEYDLALNRDGKLKKVTAVTITGPTTAKVKTIASKDQVYDSVAQVYDYRVNFTDGTALNVSDLVFAAASRNGVALGGVSAADVWNAATANDMWYMTGAGPYTVKMYAPSVSGRLVHAAGNSTFVIQNSSGTPIASFNTLFSTAITENGVAKDAASVTVDGSAGADFLGTVTFATTSVNLEPVPTTLAVERFNSTTAYPVKAIASNATAYTFTLDLGNGSTVDVVANVSATDAVEDAIIMKGGVKIAAADVAIGNKLMVAAPVSGNTPYIKAASDTTAPKAVVTQTSWTAEQAGPPVVPSSFTVRFTSDEPASKGYVWVGGVQYEATFAAGVWSKTITGLSAIPSVITVAVTDYAGNVSSAVDRTVLNAAAPHIYVLGVSATIDKALLDISAADTGAITPTLNPGAPTNAAVSYSSSNTAVATVSPAGVVTPVAAGTCVITVTTQEGSFTATIDITVQD